MCCVLSCSVNQPTTLSLPGRSLPEQCAPSCHASYPCPSTSISMRLSMLAWRCLSSCTCQCLSCVGHYVTQMSFLRLSFRLRPLVCACPFVCALNVHAWSFVCALSARVLSSAPLHLLRQADRPFMWYVSSSDVARRRLLMPSVPLIRTAANPQSRWPSYAPSSASPFLLLFLL